MADEVVLEEVLQSDVETAADEDWRMPSIERRVPPLELDYWTGRRPEGRLSDGNVTGD